MIIADIDAFHVISSLFKLFYVNLQAVFTSTKLLPHVVEFGPSPTQGIETMLLEYAKIFPSALSAKMAQSHAFSFVDFPFNLV